MTNQNDESALTDEQMKRAILEVVQSHPGITTQALEAAIDEFEGYAITHAIFELWRHERLCIGWTIDDGLMLEDFDHRRERCA